MVFIGDIVYRVIHKGGTKFSGKRVDYKGEEGLKGVFNMKTPGKPSVVLNHNKTPFHWITLKYTDVSQAVRAIGPALFEQDVILESKNEMHPIDIKGNIILGELFKLMKGEDHTLKITEVTVNDRDIEDGREAFNDIIEQEIADSGSASNIEITMEITGNQIDDNDILTDFLEININLFTIHLNLMVSAEGRYWEQRPTYDHPGHSTAEITEVNTKIIDPITIDIDDIDLTDENKKSLSEVNSKINNEDPYDIAESIFKTKS